MSASECPPKRTTFGPLNLQKKKLPDPSPIGGNSSNGKIDSKEIRFKGVRFRKAGDGYSWLFGRRLQRDDSSLEKLGKGHPNQSRRAGTTEDSSKRISSFPRQNRKNMMRRLLKRYRYHVGFLILVFCLNLYLLYNYVDRTTGPHPESVQIKGPLTTVKDEKPVWKPKLCNITSEAALKAIGKTRSGHCADRIRDTVCKLQDQSLYPLHLSRKSCPTSDWRNAKQYVGCFRDEIRNRVFRNAEWKFKHSNSLNTCVHSCVSVGANLAGLEYGEECFCGQDADLESAQRIGDDLCNTYKCPSGSENETCGGYMALKVYKTGFGKTEAKVLSYQSKPDPNLPLPKIVFLLQLNGRATRQVTRLIKLIYRPYHYYYVHVDSRQEFMYNSMRDIQGFFQSKGFDNFQIKEKRFATIWGGNSLLDMYLDAVKDLLTLWKDWDIIVNLSEADFFIMGLDEMEALIQRNPGISFLRSHGKNTKAFIQRQGVNRAFVECDEFMYRVGDKWIPWGIRINGGSDWIGVTRELANYSIHSVDEINLGLKEMFKYSLLPLESFYHTLAANSQFCSKVADSNFKMTNWNREQGCKCQYLHVVDWCGCSPNVIKENKFRKFSRPGIERRLFYTARKFEAIIDQEAVAMAEEQALRTESRYAAVSPTAFDSFWQSVWDAGRDRQRPMAPELNAFARSIVRIYCVSRRGPINNCELAALKEIQIVKRPFLTGSLEGGGPQSQQLGILISAQIRFLCHQNQDLKNKGNDEPPEVSEMQILVHRKPFPTVRLPSSVSDVVTLDSLDIGSEFDLKEEIFRNYPGVIGVNHRPIVLRTEWTGKPAVFQQQFKTPNILQQSGPSDGGNNNSNNINNNNSNNKQENHQKSSTADDKINKSSTSANISASVDNTDNKNNDIPSTPSKFFNLTIHWANPYGQIVQHSTLDVDLAAFLPKPTAKTAAGAVPISHPQNDLVTIIRTSNFAIGKHLTVKPGLWTVQISLGKIPFAKFQFPIFPFVLSGGYESEGWTDAMKADLDQMTSKFFEIQADCLHYHTEEATLPKPAAPSSCLTTTNLKSGESCLKSSWSSWFPDPKSDIRDGFDSVLGTYFP